MGPLPNGRNLWLYKRGMIQKNTDFHWDDPPSGPKFGTAIIFQPIHFAGLELGGWILTYYSCCRETRSPPTHPLTRVAMLCLTSISSTLRLHEDLWGDGEILQGNPSQCRLPPPENSKKSTWKWMVGIRFRFAFGAFWQVAKNSFRGSVGVVDSPNSLESLSTILICRVLERICA